MISIPLIILLAVVVIVIYFISIYNRLVKLKNNRENAFADIDVQLRQRHDLVPQLVESVRGYMKHEAEVLTRVTEARTRAVQATGIEEKIRSEQDLTAALRGLNVQVEAYPDLKANQNFLQLQEEIADVENKLAASRRYFNSATRELNVGIQKFPNNMVAGMFGFHTATMFDLGTTDRKTMEEPPKISF